MAKFFSSHLLGTVLLLATIVLVKSLPTSVLVDTKQQTQPSSSAPGAINKEKDTDATNNAPSLERNLLNGEKAQPKLHAQKRGVKQNLYDRDLSNDILVNNNIPNGVWEDNDASALYPDLQELEDYQAYQQLFKQPYRQRPYENLQHILNSDNFDDPLALPVKYQYPRYLDERRKRAISKNILRLKRDSTKLNTADMLTLLAFLEANERNRYDNEIDDINSLEYQKPLYGPASSYGHAVDVDDEKPPVNEEWWNEWVEPSVQYYGNPYGHVEQSPRDRHSSKAMYPAKRFMVSKKKRSLNLHKQPEHFLEAASALKSKMGSGFDSRYSAAQRF